jgi:bacillolysin
MKKILCIAAMVVSAHLIGQSNSKLIAYASEYNYNANKDLDFVKFKETHQVSQDEVTDFLNMMLFSNTSIKAVLMKAETDLIGWTNLRYGIQANGVELSNKMIIAHCVNGKLISVNGDLSDITNLSGQFSLTEAAALQKALNKVNATKYKWENKAEEAHLREALGQPDFSYAPVGIKCYLELKGKFVAAYKFNIYAEQPLYKANVFVNASTGTILDEQNLICTNDVSGTALTRYSGTQTITCDQQSASLFRLREVSRGLGVDTYNMNNTTTYSATDFTNASTAWTSTVAADKVARDAHWGAETTYDYYFQTHNRNSVDNAGYKLLSYVHYSTNYNNAFWDGTKMTYGDGNGTTFTPLTGLDVCGHEMSHGVTSNSGNLTYQNESGALNEGNSDIFGTCVENFGRPSQWDWKIGVEITPSGNGIRNMANPNQFNHPDTYQGTNWYVGTADNGGVHTNSGVYNFWFYTLTSGGTGVNDISNSYTVSAIGMLNAAKIAYRALTVYYTPSTNYANARALTIQAAKDLFGNCSNEVIQTTNAWYAVGVGPVYSSTIAPSFYAGSTSACTLPANISFNNTTANGVGYTWYFGDNTTSSAVNPVHTYSANGTYTVTLVATGCLSNTASIVQNNYITINSPVTPTTTGATTCPGGTVMLAATGGTLLNWYSTPALTTLVNTGPTYNTPILNNTTTYYVVNTVTNAPAFGGMPSNTGGGFLTNPQQWLVFDVLQNSTIMSVNVYANTAGTRTIELRNSANAVLNTLTISLTTGTNVVNLNFNVSTGTGYQLGLDPNSTADMYRSNTGVTYPYNINGCVSITGSSAGTGYYYWYYNWKVKKADCVSASAPVTASVGSQAITLSASQTDFCIGAAAPVQVNATPAGGTFSGPGMTGNMFNPASAGQGTFTISYTYTDPNTNCTGTSTMVMTVSDCTGLDQMANAANGIKIYPNPTKDQVTITNAMIIQDMKVSICDATGRVITEQAIISNEQKINTSQLANGIYFMNIKQGNAIVRTVKLVKE